MTHKIQITTDDIRQFSEQTLRKAKNKLARTSDAVSDKVSDVEYQVSRYMKKNPYKSVAASLLAGLVLSQLLRFRWKSKRR